MQLTKRQFCYVELDEKDGQRFEISVDPQKPNLIYFDMWDGDHETSMHFILTSEDSKRLENSLQIINEISNQGKEMNA